jgi:hypothetical protein
MEDNRRLILETTVSDEDAVRSDTNSSQTINASTPADMENTTTLDVSLPVEGTVADPRSSMSSDEKPLIIPASVCMIDNRVVSVSIDTRLASSRWLATSINGQLDPQLVMASHPRNRDAYLTIVDMLGRRQPGVHHLLKEGGNGFITYENGSRILIL